MARGDDREGSDHPLGLTGVTQVLDKGVTETPPEDLESIYFDFLVCTVRRHQAALLPQDSPGQDQMAGRDFVLVLGLACVLLLFLGQCCGSF